MSLAQKIEQDRTKKDESKSNTNRRVPPIWEDPRPDLEDDHKLWSRLLGLCCSFPYSKQGYELCGILHGMRCGGTRLVKGKKGFVFRPLIDEKLGWDTQEDYEEVRDKFMKPHQTSIKALLTILNDEFGDEYL